MSHDRNAATVHVDGHRIGLTNLGKMLYPAAGVTKRDVIDYYTAVAETLLPYLAGRPVTRKRWPDGVGMRPFFQKHLDANAPSWVRGRSQRHREHSVRYPIIDSAATLIYLAQRAALELHVPQWCFGPRGGRENPDRLVLDLDPGPGVGLAECVSVARAIRDMLARHGPDLVPVTSGSKGMHLYLGLNGAMTSAQVSDWAKRLARAVERSMPDLVVSRMAKTDRTGRVLIDWSQNNGAKTTISPYSLRGRDQATVAAPRSWDELDDPEVGQLQWRDVLHRVEELGDLAAPLAAAAGPPPPPDRLRTYRSKRSARHTTEPVPDESTPAATGTGDGFVIQEHHARRPHWDFRLEHDGVLASWALPKCLPTSTGHRRLAVRTEDHPLAYASFSGTIPEGEYGAGEVSIWDSGRYRVERWRDDEIVVVLHGHRASGRYVLVHTDDDHWLMRLMRDQTQAAAPPRGLAPMLATAGDTDHLGEGPWRLEGKWDGVRAIAELEHGGLTIRGRSGRDLTGVYPELSDPGGRPVGHEAVLDGEIVALNRHGAPSFALLQQRMNLTGSRRIAAMAERVPVCYYVFDLLYLDGVSLLGKTYDDRRRILDALGIAAAHWQVPAQLTGSPAHALEISRERALEGIVAKRADSTYRPGRRSHTWIKVKLTATRDVVIVGWRPGNGRRSGGIGSLLVAIPAAEANHGTDGTDATGNRLSYAGRVGTGLSDAALDRLLHRLKPLRRTTPALAVPAADARDAVWVRPKLVGEVTHTEITSAGRLRHPVWRRLRDDLPAGQARRGAWA